MKKLLFIIVLFGLFTNGGFASILKTAFEKEEFESVYSIFYQTNENFSITGPNELCLYNGNVIGEFFGGGLVTDVFRWRVIHSDGSILVDRVGAFQTFNHTFSEAGFFDIELTVRRGANQVFSGSKSIKINADPDLLLEGSYLLCDNGTANLTLLNPESDVSSYQIEWFDGNGNAIGTGNSIVVDKPDNYRVNFNKVSGELGTPVCHLSLSTFVYQPKDYSISISESEVCFSGTDIIVSASDGVFGNWFYQKEGTDVKELLGEGNELVFRRGELDGPGNYDIIFEVDNSANEFCKLSDSVTLNLIVQPSFRFYFESGAESCGSEDGVLVILPSVDLDYVQLRRNNENLTRFFNLKQGEEFRIPGMKSGLYRASGGIGSCTTGRSAAVPNSNPGPDLLYSLEEIIGETCNETGKINGSFKVKMLEEGVGRNFIIYNSNGVSIQSGAIENNEFEFTGPAGNFYFEIINQEGCVNPSPERITIESKGQVSFSVPTRITVCETFDYIPDTNEDLIFTLTYPDNSTEIKKSGEPFVLNQEGTYTLKGIDADLERAFCPRESSFMVNLTAPVAYEPELVSKDCFGNQQFRVNLFGADPSRVDIRWYNENEEVVGTSENLFPTSHGEFKLDVQPKNSESCPMPPKSFIVNEPVVNLEILLEAEILCPGSNSSITLNADLGGFSFNILWYFIDLDGNISELQDFEDQTQISIQNPGTYESVVFNDLNCEIGRAFISIVENSEFADFELPEKLIICESLEYFPESELDLFYEVIRPNGDQITLSKDIPFIIDQIGVYTFTSFPSNATEAFCPITKSVTVEIADAVRFEPELYEKDCDGRLVFRANLFGTDITEVDIFWFDEKGEFVGNDEFLEPVSYGEFSLEVRPKGSKGCPAPNKVEFEVIKPIVELDARLNAAPFCPGNEAVTLTLEGDLDQVSNINWYFTDHSGRYSILEDFSGQHEIVVSEEGTYEVEVFNDINCLLLKDLILVVKSNDDVRPEVNETYQICAQLGIAEVIDPGIFSFYQWYLESDLISEDPTFSPKVAGNYTLTVTSFEGCDYSAAFTVVEECNVEVKHPTGMKVNDPERPFLVYTNYLVDQLDIWIYNKWGQLVYHCSKTNLSEGEPYCIWYGDLNGETIQPGSYSVKMTYRNNSEKISNSTFSNLMVLE
jgi:hypothetical protein